MFMHPFPKCPASFSHIQHLVLVIRLAMTLLISQVMCFDKSYNLNDLCVKLHYTEYLYRDQKPVP